MAYAKLTPVTSSNTIYMGSYIRNYLNGTDPATMSASLFNQGASFQAGTQPTASQYGTAASDPNGSFQTAQYHSIYKRHYAYGQGTFQAERRLRMAAGTAHYNGTNNNQYYPDINYGMWMSMMDKSGSNMVPSTNTHMWSSYNPSGYTGNTGGTYSNVNYYNQIGGNNTTNFSSIHIINNDTTLMIKVKGSGTDANRDCGTWILADLEFNSTIDGKGYTGNSNYCPTIGWWMQEDDTLDNITATTSSTEYCFAVVNQQYMAKDGNYLNSTYSDRNSGYSYRGSRSSTGDNGSISPSPRDTIFPLAGPGGETLHQLIPVQYIGHQNPSDEMGDPRAGRLMNIYRTTDNAFNDGDVLTDGSTRYRVFRLHSCGSTSLDSATRRACYAFPEDNVPYA